MPLHIQMKSADKDTANSWPQVEHGLVFLLESGWREPSTAILWLPPAVRCLRLLPKQDIICSRQNFINAQPPTPIEVLCVLFCVPFAPCCCRPYLKFNLSYDCADPLVVLTLHMMLLLFCFADTLHPGPLGIFLDGHWTCLPVQQTADWAGLDGKRYAAVWAKGWRAVPALSCLSTHMSGAISSR